MIAFTYLFYDTFEKNVSRRHMNHDTLDMGVLEFTVKMHTLCRPDVAKHVNMQYLRAVTLYDSLPSRKIR